MAQIDFSFEISSPNVEIKLNGLDSREYHQFVDIFMGELSDVGIETSSLEIVHVQESSGLDPNQPGLFHVYVTDLSVNFVDLYKALERAKVLIIAYRVSSPYHAEVGVTASRSKVS